MNSNLLQILPPHCILYYNSTCISFNNLNSRQVYSSNCSWSAALCPDPADVANGMVTFAANSVSDTATYICNSGFELIGSATVTCTQVDVNSATFSPAPPVCRREYCMNIVKYLFQVYQHKCGYILCTG